VKVQYSTFGPDVIGESREYDEIEIAVGESDERVPGFVITGRRGEQWYDIGFVGANQSLTSWEWGNRRPVPKGSSISSVFIVP